MLGPGPFREPSQHPLVGDSGERERHGAETIRPSLRNVTSVWCGYSLQRRGEFV